MNPCKYDLFAAGDMEQSVAITEMIRVVVQSISDIERLNVYYAFHNWNKGL